MAERRKTKTKKRDKKSEDDLKITKEDYQIGKYLRFKCPTKQSTMMGNEVSYFTGAKAVDCLMQSKWATGSGCLFSSREACVEFMQSLLVKEFFYRSRRLVQKPRDKDKDKEGTSSQKGTPKPKRDKTKKVNADEPESKSPEATAKDKTATAESNKETADKATEKEKEKDKEKKKKVKLEYHTDQVFVDGNDAYVWIYDPTSVKTWILGSLIVLGSIGICVFPLWPPEVRLGVYYLSMAAMGFVGFILLLVVVRGILFGFVWVLTLGRHHFWLLPNLTEDCGFFESFKPFYSHSYCPPKSKSSDIDNDKSKDEDVKSSDREDACGIGKDDDQNTDSDRDSDKANNERKEGETTLRQRKRRPRKDGDDEAVHSSSSQGSNSGFEIVDEPSPRAERA